MAFCDFCDCEGCRDGTPGLSHAQTEDGRWICDTCYDYEVCIDAFRAEGVNRMPCGHQDGDQPCPHRPTLATGWVTKGDVP